MTREELAAFEAAAEAWRAASRAFVLADQAGLSAMNVLEPLLRARAELFEVARVISGQS